MIDVGSAVAHLDLDTSQFHNGVNSAVQDIDSLSTKTTSAVTALEGLGKGMENLGSKLTRSLTLPIAGAFTMASKSAIDYESAFASVRKTVDATEEEYQELSDTILELSSKMPQSASAIAEVMSVAGQLGVRGKENLTEFTKTMIMLGDATNLTSEDAATALARVMNIMGTAGTDVDKLGATVVALGNNFATTESEIVEMTNRLAAGAKLAGLTEAETMALATAMSSVGIRAEAGGTAMVQTFNAIEKAVGHGDETLDSFARVAGLTAEEFTEAWKKRPLEALQSFITGLNTLDEEGESTVLVLEELGLQGIRQSNMLKSLALANGMLTDTVDLANKAWDENAALTKEAETRYGTMASQLSILKNNAVNLAMSFGELLLPSIGKAVEKIQGFIDWINTLSDGQKSLVIKILGIVAAIGPVLSIMGKLLQVIPAIVKGVKLLSTAFSAISAPVWGVVAAIAAVGLIFKTLWDNNEAFREKMIELWENLKEVIGGFIEDVQERFSGLAEAWEYLTGFIAEIWESLCNLFAPLFEGAFKVVIDTIKGALDFIVGLIDIFIGIFTADWNTIYKGLEEAFVAVMNWLLSIGPTLLITIGNILKSILDLVLGTLKTLLDDAITWFGNVFDTIGEWLGKAFDAIVEWFKGIPDTVSGWITTAINAIIGLKDSALEAGKTLFNNLWDGMKAIWDNIWGWIKGVGEDIENFFTGIWDGIKGIGQWFGGLFSGSHANGLDYVPYNGYIAQLHQGERVLTKEEAKEYDSGSNKGGDTFIFNSPKEIDEYEAARLLKKTKMEMEWA